MVSKFKTESNFTNPVYKQFSTISNQFTLFFKFFKIMILKIKNIESNFEYDHNDFNRPKLTSHSTP